MAQNARAVMPIKKRPPIRMRIDSHFYIAFLMCPLEQNPLPS